MYNNTESILAELVEFGKRIADKQLVVGPGGNTSARLTLDTGDIIYMKASGKCFEDGNISDYIGVNLKTKQAVEGNLKPTCEISLHLKCYELRSDVNAVIHTHPPYATAYAMLGKTLKAFTPDFVAVVGTEIPTAGYVPPGGTKLAEEIAKYIKKYNAVFMMNHGLITVGSNLREAFYRTLVVEDAVKTVVASKILGKFKVFTDTESKCINNMDAEKYRMKLLKK